MNTGIVIVSVSTEKNNKIYDSSPTEASNCVEDITYADEIAYLLYGTVSKFKNQVLQIMRAYRGQRRGNSLWAEYI